MGPTCPSAACCRYWHNNQWNFAHVESGPASTAKQCLPNFTSHYSRLSNHFTYRILEDAIFQPSLNPSKHSTVMSLYLTTAKHIDIDTKPNYRKILLLLETMRKIIWQHQTHATKTGPDCWIAIFELNANKKNKFMLSLLYTCPCWLKIAQ
jgi:hypothetical protein